MHCPRCKSDITPENRYCSSCGLSLEETVIGQPRERGGTGVDATGMSRSASVGWLASSPSLDGGFAPGTVLLGRYRVIGLLGRGGMGEVYRADDLTLGQAVALKFLPRDLASNAERLARFHTEVRVARQVSHPNVCRVYDIADLGGQPFLSMEFVDGEDLASLLRRIGRLPGDKIVEIARQICAGLAAAHNMGVLHRDLKPANIMLDRQGKVRLTDFGLAVLQERANAAERAGTPAYMAPEQLAGRDVSIQSDLYALGLVLFEMLTGKRPHRGQSLHDLGAERSRIPDSPSSFVEAVDPVLERVILRCLEPEPTQRPKSAVAVAASLPGGDPLAAALEAGETPSPDMVAAAGAEGRLRPAVAWSLLGGVLAALAVVCLIASRYTMVNSVPLPKRPAVLEDRATEIVRTLGYTAAGDRASGFFYNDDYLNYVTRHDSSLTRWQQLKGEPAAILFWYRQSPAHMRPRVFGSFRVRYDDPEPVQRGMLRLALEPSGSLVHFHAVPPEVDSVAVAVTSPTPAQESQLFTLAGLEPERFTSSPSTWVPPVHCDVRRAWTGTFAERPDLPLRLESGWHAGRLVYFERLGPWRQPQARGAQDGAFTHAGAIVSTLLILGLLLGSVLHARANLRQGRGDRRGATRLALFILGLHLTSWVFLTNHTASLAEEFDMLIEGLAIILFVAGFFWVIYIALEPHMRRTWPDLIISWTRLLAGRLRDPLVGRDILVGVLFGCLGVLIHSLEQFLPAWLGIPPHYPRRVNLLAMASVPHAVLTVMSVLGDTMFTPLATALLLLALRQLVRSRVLAAALVVLALGFLVGSQGDPSGAHPQISIPMGFVAITVWMILVLRFGVLALVTAIYVTNLLMSEPIASPAAWFAGSGAVAVVVSVALALVALRHALGAPARRQT